MVHDYCGMLNIIFVHVLIQTTIAKNPVLTGCIKPNVNSDVLSPVLLLHGFDRRVIALY